MVTDQPGPTASDDGAALEIDDVTVAYAPASAGDEPTLAVSGVTLGAAGGEVLALVGASGSGKSSLLRAVAGLEALAGGRIRIGGTDLRGLPVHRRGVGMVFQDGQLFEHLSVEGNVVYGLRSLPRGRRPDRVQQRARIAELLELVGLAGMATRPVTTLSGGQAQRIALARALAPEPRVLLLDEPLSALDRALRERLAVDLAAILRAAGTTAVHVTHDLDEAATIADRIAVLDGGRLLQVGTPADLWRAPATREVADLLGYGPILPADRLGLGGGLVALAPGALVALAPGEDTPPDVVAHLPATPVARRHVRGRWWLDVVLESGERASALLPEGGDVPDLAAVSVVRSGVVRVGE
jgi:thiamine transport system ATP-binding protein